MIRKYEVYFTCTSTCLCSWNEWCFTVSTMCNF